jgi:tetratricopeptide (TPR) repeat protein
VIVIAHYLNFCYIRQKKTLTWKKSLSNNLTDFLVLGAPLLKYIMLTKCKSHCFALAIFFVLLGCTIITKFEGEYYLGEEKYNEGIDVFREKLQNDPWDSEAHFYMGRYLLAINKPNEAFSYLKQAVRLNFKNADYHFWLGVCYNELDKPIDEKKSYLRAIKYDPRHIDAHLYLGHSYLEHRQWDKALVQYKQVLKLDNNHPQALYNCGLALNKLQRYSKEIAAWKEYLKFYPEGKWAIRAVDHLNARGNFEYRNYIIGYRRVPLKQIRFEELTKSLIEDTIPSVDAIGSILSVNKKIHLKIIGYQNGNKSLAKKRADTLGNYLINNFSEIEPYRLTTEGIGTPEKIKIGSKEYSLSNSINVVTIEK